MGSVKSLYRGVLCIVCMFFGTFIYANDFAIDIDLRDALQSRRLDVEEKASIEELPKGVVEGDIYNTSYARAELQIAAPAADSLQSTFDYIAGRCDGQLAMNSLTTVFALTTPGQELGGYLKRRGIIDDFTESEDYAGSCVEIVKCFYDASLSDEQKEQIGYDTQNRRLCEDIVEETYEMMSTSVSALANLQEINYGDDMLMNAKKDDGPFDLLQDIEQIGNILFSHNDTASELHFYDVQTPGSYVDNDPDVTTTYTTQAPNADEEDRLLRLPATNGVDPDFPKSIFYDQGAREPEITYTAPTEPTNDFSLYTDRETIGGSPLDSQALSEALGAANELPAASTINNNICLPPADELEEELDELVLAELEQAHTYTYNKKLDLDTRIALASAAIMLPEVEEQLGIDPVVILEEGGIDPRSLPPLVTDAGLDGEELELIENGMINCVEQFTEIDIEITNDDGSIEVETSSIDSDAVKKVVRKSITQPTALTKCITDLLCFEVGDETGRGLFRIQGCTIPSRKAYGVIDSQKVISIEEVVDEFVNVCQSLKESGQLLEHNKTKDALDHKLMRVDFSEKFSFSLSVGFKGLRDGKDPAYEKRMARENNDYLMTEILGINDYTGQEQQRNKYVTLYQPKSSATANGIYTAEQQMFANTGELIAEQRGFEIDQKEEYSQLLIHARSLDVLDAFVDLNTSYWGTINDTTHAIMQNRQAEMKESQQKG